MRSSLTLAAAITAGAAHAQAGSFQLALDPPGNNTFLQYADASLFDDGSIVVLAQNSWSLMTSTGVVTKLSVDGAILWSRSIEPSGTAYAMVAKRVLAMPDGGVTVFASVNDALWTESEFALIRFDANGAMQWSQRLSPGPGPLDWDYGYSAARPTADGGLVVNMGMTTIPTFVRMDPDGNVLWARSFITDDPDTSKVPTFDFGIDDNGGLIITEKANADMMLIRTDADGNVLWSHRYPSGLYTHTKIAVPLANGDLLCSGYSDSPFAARLDPAGNILWMRNYAMTGIWDGFHRIIELDGGDILLSARCNSTGSPMTSSDLMLRIDANGTPLGRIQLTTDLLAPAMELVGLNNGMLVFGGQATVPVDGGYDVYHMLWRVDASLDATCGVDPALVPVTTTDLEPLVTMTDGCNATDRLVDLASFPVDVVNAVYAATDLCAMITNVHEQDALPVVAVFPSPVVQGGNATIELDGDADRIEVLAADGRIVASIAVNARPRLQLATNGWSSGLYVVRATDRDGVLRASARLIVE